MDDDFLETIYIDTSDNYVNEADYGLDPDEIEEVSRLSYQMQKYLHKLDLTKYSQETERLKILYMIGRNFVPGYNTFIRKEYECPDGQTPGNISMALDRMLISVFNQMERIANQDLRIP